NRLLQNLVIKCAKSEGVRDYYYVGVVGYGTRVKSAFGGSLADKDLVPISVIADSPVEIEERNKKVDDGAGGLVEQKVRFPIWFQPVAYGGTPMSGALREATRITKQWLSEHPDCFPPIIINITDGEATDGQPSPPAEELRNLSSSDGNVLLFNAHISSKGGATFEFPSSEVELPDRYAKQLFSMSSVLPDYMRDAAEQEGYMVAEESRGFVFNADIVSVIRFLDIGTRPSNLR
ncbi:MAG: VWA domain-containing protein, partial [Chloroflexi bacterium]|nr:VWA domain-containing protein [Chloroflexota bacterium]